MAVYRIAFPQFPDLLYAMNHFPVDTPKRWDSIADYMLKRVELRDDIDGPLCSTVTPLEIEEKCIFEFNGGSPNHCKEVGLHIQNDENIIEYLATQDIPLYSAPSKQSASKPLVMLPYTKTCCGNSLEI